MAELPQKKFGGNGREKRDTEVEADTKGPLPERCLTYDVLRIIFKYLNGKELSSASMVCRLWLEAGNGEKSTRGPASLMEDCDGSLNTPKSILELIKTRIIRKLRIQPALGLFFTSCEINNEGCYCEGLPQNCETIALSTYGVVYNNTELEDNFTNVVCAFLPEIPGTTIRTFVIATNETSHGQGTAQKYTEELKEMFGSAEKDTTRCLLLLSDIRGRRVAMQILNSVKRCYRGAAMSVWGGVTKEIEVCNKHSCGGCGYGTIARCTGILLTGSVQTWSIIVDKSCKTKKGVEERLVTMRSGINLKKHSLGFMFACCARGENMFDEHNVESTIFKRIFPDVPLVGCFGDGEFGENTVPSGSSSKNARWYNESSTVFLVLTYG